MRPFLPVIAATAALCLAAPLWAAGSDDDTPPVPTQTTAECAEGMVWDVEKASCVAIEQSNLDDDALYGAARELAYAGRLDDAIAVLARMSDQDAGRVQTYLGFAHARAGRLETGFAHYQNALARDPDNLLARSYMGQALVKAGARSEARSQLAEIRARGGAGGWSERALMQAIDAGIFTDY